MSFSTNSDLLNTILIIFFPIKEVTSGIGGKISKRDVTAYVKMTEYVDFALSDLVLHCFVRFERRSACAKAKVIATYGHVSSVVQSSQ